MVEVTQADREMAAALACGMGEHDIAANILAGSRDRFTWVQHFARCRIAAENAALERAAKVADRHDTGDCTREDMEARAIAAAIRALKGPSNAD